MRLRAGKALTGPTGRDVGMNANHAARSSSATRRRLMITRRCRKARGRHLAISQKAFKDEGSHKSDPPSTIRSRAIMGAQHRRQTPAVVFLTRIRKRFFTECMLMTPAATRRFAGVTVRTWCATAAGRINAAPPQQLRAPRDVGVLAVDEEIGIEEIAVDRNIVDHAPAVERRGGAGAEDVLHSVPSTVRRARASRGRSGALRE